MELMRVDGKWRLEDNKGKHEWFRSCLLIAWLFFESEALQYNIRTDLQYTAPFSWTLAA